MVQAKPSQARQQSHSRGLFVYDLKLFENNKSNDTQKSCQIIFDKLGCQIIIINFQTMTFGQLN